MKITTQIRREIKTEQKKRVFKTVKRCMGANVLVTLPAALIVFLGLLLCGRVGISQQLRFSTNYSMMELYQIMQAFKKVLNIYLGMAILLLLIVSPLKMGLMQFYLTLSRQEDASLAIVLRPFTSLRAVWRAIRMQACMWFRTFLWLFMPVMLYMTAMSSFLLNWSLLAENDLQIFVVSGFCMVCFLVLRVKIALYKAGYTIVSDYQGIGVWFATAIGGQMFRGQFRSMLVFFCSFLPWYALYGVLTAGGLFLVQQTGTVLLLGFVWFVLALCLDGIVKAYQNTSFFALADRMQQEENPAMREIDINEQFLQWIQQAVEEAQEKDASAKEQDDAAAEEKEEKADKENAEQGDDADADESQHS